MCICELVISARLGQKVTRNMLEFIFLKSLTLTFNSYKERRDGVDLSDSYQMRTYLKKRQWSIFNNL